MTDVHNHDIDPACPERRMPDGSLRGECMTTYEPPAEAVEAAARRLWRDEYGSISSPDHLRTPESDEAERDKSGYGSWDSGRVSECVMDAVRRKARFALTAAGPLIAAEALEGQQGVYGESPAAGDVMMPPETLMQRMEADGRHWRNAYAEGFLSGQVSALRGFADTTRFPSHWVLFRRSDGSGVTVSDLLREAAARIARGEGS